MLWLQFSAIFDNFRRKKCVFLKNQCYDQFFQNLALFWAKNVNFFAKIFGENILKIITSVPGYFWNFQKTAHINQRTKIHPIWSPWLDLYFYLPNLDQV
jgi:hypothetical protein